MQEGMEYPEHHPYDCLFCRWIKGGKAVETHGTVSAFNDGYPVTEGHLLVAPLRHTTDWLSMTSQEIRDSEALIRTLVERIRQRDPSVTGFNLGTNIGASNGQTVLHAHIHLIPRRDGDTANPEGGIRGVIDGKRGFVLTNNHVIEKATSISVTLNDKREFEAAIVGMDPDSDLAVLKIQADQALPAIQMGNSDDIMIGESIIAIGNPFGLSHTLTVGVVSAKGRTSLGISDYEDFIQTDASINPGNSGGPLFNLAGSVVGINTAINRANMAEGIGFALQIDEARRAMDQLLETGEVRRGLLGITMDQAGGGGFGDLAGEASLLLVVSQLQQWLESNV